MGDSYNQLHLLVFYRILPFLLDEHFAMVCAVAETYFETNKLTITLAPCENGSVEIHFKPKSELFPHFEGPAGNQAFLIMHGIEEAFTPERSSLTHHLDYRTLTIAPRDGQDAHSLMTNIDTILKGLLQKKEIAECGELIRADADSGHVKALLQRAMCEPTHEARVQIIIDEEHLTPEARRGALDRLKEREDRQKQEGGRG